MLASKRILIVTNDAWFFVSHRLPIAAALSAANAQCHVLAHKDDTVPQITDTGAHFHHWDITPRSTSVLKELKSALHLLRTIHNLKPDIVHLVTIKPVLYGGFIARLLRVPGVVFAISGMGYLFQDKEAPKSPTQVLAKLFYRFVLRHKNGRVIVQNRSDREFFITEMKVAEDKVFQLPGSGVNLQSFQAAHKSNDVPVIVLTARMLWDKGIEYFVEAAKIINSDTTRARFVLVGLSDPDNPRSVPIETLETWQQEGVVEYFGHRSDIPQILANADIYCLPTIYGEGLPKAILEAMASGCATVATNWPGCNEVISDGENGLLVTPKDTDQLVDTLSRLIDNKELRHSLGTQARITVERGYSVETVVQQTLAIYERLLES